MYPSVLLEVFAWLSLLFVFGLMTLMTAASSWVLIVLDLAAQLAGTETEGGNTDVGEPAGQVED
jgi:hypothetical protein